MDRTGFGRLYTEGDDIHRNDVFRSKGALGCRRLNAPSNAKTSTTNTHEHTGNGEDYTLPPAGASSVNCRPLHAVLLCTKADVVARGNLLQLCLDVGH